MNFIKNISGGLEKARGCFHCLNGNKLCLTHYIMTKYILMQAKLTALDTSFTFFSISPKDFFGGWEGGGIVHETITDALWVLLLVSCLEEMQSKANAKIKYYQVTSMWPGAFEEP